jgi:hypothetical protein
MYVLCGAVLAHSIWCLTADWTTRVRSRQWQRIFFSSVCVQISWGPLSLLFNWYQRSFPGGKARPGRDADHSPLLLSRSRMSRRYISCPRVHIKVKLSRTRHAVAKVERKYTSYSFLTSARDEGKWSASLPSRALPSGKGSQVPIGYKTGRRGRVVKTLSSSGDPGFKSRPRRPAILIDVF